MHNEKIKNKRLSIFLQHFSDNMKVVILAGGFGTRLSEYTKLIPKPMVKVGKIPMIAHIIKYYMKYDLKDYVAGGYKFNILKSILKNKIKCKYRGSKYWINSLTGKELNC